MTRRTLRSLALPGGSRLEGGGVWTPASLVGPSDNAAWFTVAEGFAFQGSDGTTPAAVASVVGYLTDRSGKGNHATEATNKPLLAEDANGRWVLQFDGTNDRLQFTNPVTGTEDHTVCYVGYGAATSDDVLSLGLVGAGNASRSFNCEMAIRTVGNSRVYNDTNLVKSVVTHRLEGARSGDNRVWKNGQELAVTSTNSTTDMATTADPSTIGYGSSGWGQIYLYSLFVIDRALTDAERERLEAYMAAEAGIPYFYDLFFMVGQSNMQGRAPYDGLGGHASNTFQWGASGGLVAATVPLAYEFQPADTMGLDISFSEAWRAAHPDPIVFVTGARGSTGYNDLNWNQGNTIYTEAVAKANAALAGIPGARMKGILSVLGENDAQDSVTQAQFAAYTDAMIAAMRADIKGASVTPFVAGQIIVGSFPTSAEVKAAITDLPNRVTGTAVAANTGLSHGGDGLHYDAASLRTLGGRMFTALDSLL